LHQSSCLLNFAIFQGSVNDAFSVVTAIFVNMPLNKDHILI